MLKIVLDQPWQRAFFSGSQVSGTLHVEVDCQMSCNFIKVKLYGQARTRLYIERSKYTSDAELVNSQVIVHEGMLQPGQYVFPFWFTLPEQIPSTFQPVISGKGSVEYFVEGWIFLQGPGVPLVNRVHVPVTETVTVLHPWLQTPVTERVQQRVRHWYCLHSPGNVVLAVESPCTSYCAGEEVPLTVKVQNDTDCQVTVKAVLLRTMTYSAQGKQQQSTYMIVKQHRGNPVQPRSTITWRPLGMRTDSAEKVTSNSANIITVKHSVEVTAEVVIPLSVDKLLKTEIPLTIGNVLYQDTNEVRGHAPSPTPPSYNQLIQTTPHTPTHVHGYLWQTSQAPPTDTPPTYNAAIGTENSTSSAAIFQAVSPPTHTLPTSIELTSLPPPPYEIALTMPHPPTHLPPTVQQQRYNLSRGSPSTNHQLQPWN